MYKLVLEFYEIPVNVSKR